MFATKTVGTGPRLVRTALSYMRRASRADSRQSGEKTMTMPRARSIGIALLSSSDQYSLVFLSAVFLARSNSAGCHRRSYGSAVSQG